jgi:Immunity protein 8
VRAMIHWFEWAVADIHGTDEVIELVLHVGRLNSSGDELFTVHVCTIDALAKLLLRNGMVIGRHCLFVPDINTERIEAFLNDRMRRLDGGNWRDLAEKIARIGSWEFEDDTADREQQTSGSRDSLVPLRRPNECRSSQNGCRGHLCVDADAGFDAPTVRGQARVEGVQCCLCANIGWTRLCEDHDAPYRAHRLGMGGHHLPVQRVRHVRQDLSPVVTATGDGTVSKVGPQR